MTETTNIATWEQLLADRDAELHASLKENQKLREALKLINIEEEAVGRLAHIFGDDTKLAQTVYDYVIKGHLAHAGNLCGRFAQCRKKR